MARAFQKLAVIVACTVEVQCPACGEPQPAPYNGSEYWEVDELVAAAGKKLTCVSCDNKFTINVEHKVNLP